MLRGWLGVAGVFAQTLNALPHLTQPCVLPAARPAHLGLPVFLQILEGEGEYEEGEEGAETLTAGRSSRQRSRKHFGEHSGWRAAARAAPASNVVGLCWPFRALLAAVKLEAWVCEACPLCCAHLLQGMIL